MLPGHCRPEEEAIAVIPCFTWAVTWLGLVNVSEPLTVLSLSGSVPIAREGVDYLKYPHLGVLSAREKVCYDMFPQKDLAHGDFDLRQERD